MSGRMGLLAFVFLCAASLPANGDIVIAAGGDTSTFLQGSFSFELDSGDLYEPINFQFLPGGLTSLYIEGSRGPDISYFGSNSEGDPVWPYFYYATPDSPLTFGPLAGSYTNGGANENTLVYFRFDNLRDGGAGGTFDGNFCFSTDATTCAAAAPVPLPAAAWLLLSGLGGLGLLRRRKAV